MTNPDYRALCAELIDDLELCDWPYKLKDTIRADMERARALLAEPEAEGPTDQELASFLAERHKARMENQSPFGCPDFDGAKAKAARIADARAVLARWGRPAAAPVPVSERLPGPEDCDGEGKVWAIAYLNAWMRVHHSMISRWKAWLPANALPLPQVAELEGVTSQ